jgi:hypothetical protein
MVLGMAVPAPAGVITYTTPTGSTQGGLPVNVSATFTTGTNSLQIVVNNLGANPAGVIQNLSDLDFVISSGQTSVGSGGGIASSSGTSRSVGKAGKGSNNPFTDSGSVATGWGLTQSFTLPFGLGTGFSLCVICPSGGTVVSGPTVNPENTIIGPAAASGFYTNASGSIAGNDPHNPFLFGPVTFNLTIAGLTSASSISGVVFSFGTTAAGSDTQGCVQGACGSTTTTSVPVPPSVMLLGLGTIVGAVIVVRARRREACASAAPAV